MAGDVKGAEEDGTGDSARLAGTAGGRDMVCDQVKRIST